MDSSILASSMRQLVVGVEEQVKLLDGSTRAFINLDNASSTPFLRSVLERINGFAPMYASVGRGSGYKSHVATEAFEAARATIGRFVGASRETHTVILGKNTTEALNKLAHCLRLSGDDVILTSLMEHHSNELPWRRAATVHHIGLREDGSLDVSHLIDLLAQFGDRVRLVSITGASNVTGFINPIHDIAEVVHDAGVLFAVDAAQLAPHRAIEVGEPSDPRRIDFLAYTGHKMYAPLGIGALVALKGAVRATEPDLVGGGTVDFVTSDDVVWSELPAREEAGTPNIIGTIGWAQGIESLDEIGMAQVARHEAELTEALLTALGNRAGIEVYGDPNPERARDRLGVVTFRLAGVSHGLAAAILGYEGGIGVRTGLFCAHPYVQELVGMPLETSRDIAKRLKGGERPSIPGLIRASFGIYNTAAEVDALVTMLDRILSGEYHGDYLRDPATGAFRPGEAGPWESSGDAWSPRSCT
jgi:cysteine desulfurase/selenocysteine lyase